MVWTPALFSPGDNFTADEANTLLSPPYYTLSASDAQTITNDTVTAVEFDTVVEYNDIYDAITVPVTGINAPINGTYLLVAQGTFVSGSGPASGARELYIYSGSNQLAGVSQLASGRSWVGQVSVVRDLATSDTLSMRIYQHSAASLDTDPSAAGGCTLSIRWLGLG